MEITPQTQFWKIAPGEDAHLWNQCRSHNYIAIGWHLLGDVTQMSRLQFEQKRDQLAGTNNFYTPSSMNQLWRFAHEIKVGDYIIANRGMSTVMGIGVVTGPCEFHDEAPHYKHRLPVNWVDTRPRQIPKAGWVRTLIPLSRDDFDAILQAPIIDSPAYWKFSPYEKCWNWQICKQDDVLVLGYDGLGDISELHPTEFEARREELRLNNPQFKKSDIDAVWDLTQIQPGDWIVAIKRDDSKWGRRVLGYGQVVKPYYYDEGAPQFKHRLHVEWHENESNQFDPASKLRTLEEITATAFYAFNPQSSTSKNQQTMLTSSFPLNRILYGPPGTGKTFSTVDAALEIIDGEVPEDREECMQRFEELREAKQIGFVTFHQSFSYEEFIEGLRPVIEEEGEGDAHYDVRNGLFKSIALRALGAMLKSSRPGRVKFEDVWTAFIERIDKSPEKEYEGLTPESAFTIAVTPRGNLHAHNVLSTKIGTRYLCNRKQAEKVWNQYREQTKVTSSEVKSAVGNSHTHFIAVVFRELKKLENTTTPRQDEVAEAMSNPELLENLGDDFLNLNEGRDYELDLNCQTRYVFIIDEINRGNISKIFGELITLIEDDKRLGRPNRLSVELPYSGDTFTLPPNLYLLGTMNTADKSLALLDVALRRRFSFEEIRPDFAICEFLQDDMRQVLGKLNQRIMTVLDREHRIGHAFFMEVETENDFNRIFANKIIPLLQEYFYNDWKGLCMVLGEKDGGSIVVKMPSIDGVVGRTPYAWWYDLDLARPNFLEVLRRNYGLVGKDVVSSDDAGAA